MTVIQRSHTARGVQGRQRRRERGKQQIHPGFCLSCFETVPLELFMFDICEKCYLGWLRNPGLLFVCGEGRQGGGAVHPRGCIINVLQTWKPLPHSLHRASESGWCLFIHGDEPSLWFWGWVHISRNGPAFPSISYKQGTLHFGPAPSLSFTPLFCPLLWNSYIEGLPKPQCSKVPLIGGKQCSVGIIQTA